MDNRFPNLISQPIKIIKFDNYFGPDPHSLAQSDLMERPLMVIDLLPKEDKVQIIILL
jgi:hypothetical protein